MTRGVPVAGFRRIRNSEGELVNPPHALNGMTAPIAPIAPANNNVIPFHPNGRDVLNVSEKRVNNLNLIEVRSQFHLGNSSPKEAGNVEHILSINDGKVDFLTKFTKPVILEHAK